MFGYPQPYSESRPKRKRKQTQAKKIWKHKFEVKDLIAQTFVGVSSKNDWFLDSGCSNHMTGEDSFLEEFKPFSQGRVTFGDGIKGRIMEI